MAMLWVKTFHIVLIAAWFAGLFYLPRIYVNLAMETDPAAVRRLLLMARKLFRFMTMIAVPALACGLWLWLSCCCSSSITRIADTCCGCSSVARTAAPTSGIACSTSCRCSACSRRSRWS
jgi:uncharacterized membrane protein